LSQKKHKIHKNLLAASNSLLATPRKARLFPFPESFLKVFGCILRLGVLRKLTLSLYVDSEPLRKNLF